MSPDEAKLTLDGARLAIVKNPSAGGVGCIKVSATESVPVQGFVDFSSGTIFIEGANTSQWHCQRAQTINAGGWSSAGGGVYSRASISESSALWYVTTLADVNGFQTVLTQNTSTPTTPAAGQFGFSGGTFYVHLPDDADANLHVFKRASAGYLIRVSGTAKVTVRNMVGRYGNGSIVELTSAKLTIHGGRFHHNGHGGITAVNSAQMYLFGVLVDNNGATGPSQGERGGINYVTTTSGTCANCTSGGTVSVFNLTSSGNTLSDVLC